MSKHATKLHKARRSRSRIILPKHIFTWFHQLSSCNISPHSMYLGLQYLLRRRYSYRSFGVSILQSTLISITTSWSISTYSGFWNKIKPIWIVLGFDKVLNRMSGEFWGADSDARSVHSGTKQEVAWIIDSGHYLLVLHIFDSVVLEA